MEQILYIICGKPVLQECRRFEVEFFCAVQYRTPKIVKEINDQSGTVMGHRLQLFEYLLDVRHVVHKVGKQEVIKFL